jgi:PAP2 superfamily C-terminal
MLDSLEVSRPLSTIPRAWSHVWTERRFRLEAPLTLGTLVMVLAVMTRFLAWVELRPGVVLPDAVLALIPPRDVTWITFGLIYAGLVTVVIVLLPHPRRLVLAAQAYVVMILLRMAVMSVTPLEAPPGMIPLQDPLVQLFGSGKPFTKDLFFSGHTSTSFLLALVAPGKLSRAFFLACTAAVATCVLWQHVHYTVDVLVAPLFAFASYVIASKASKGLGSLLR